MVPYILDAWHRFSTCKTYLKHAAYTRRLVLRLAPAHHYFFWLYVVYCGALAALAALSLGHWPARGALLLYSAREDGYLVRKSEHW